MNYDYRAFEGLRDIEAAKQFVPFNAEKIGLLGDVICRHGFADTVGVSLLHRHFSLGHNERLVTRFSIDGWKAEPKVLDAEKVRPFNWKLERDNISDEWYLVPLEFFEVDPQVANEASQSDEVMNSHEFLSDIAKRIRELEVEDIFGISLLMDRRATAHHIYFERNDSKNRTMIANLVPESEIASPEGVTLWNFKEAARGVTSEGGFTKACAHGNSRHCCG